ncbi:uncharacterized protein LOC135486505 [Lineus longissimus]|uniref:uncharacterized protein LOC135486505 n=1 Tax=Lineus longissimus TaxID=88925 RepID=UPI002B4EF058
MIWFVVMAGLISRLQAGEVLSFANFDGEDQGDLLHCGAEYKPDGTFGTAAYFNGDTGYATIPKPAITKTSFTITMFIKMKTFGERQTLIADWMKPWQMLLQIESNNELRMVLRRDICSTGSLDGQNLVNLHGGNVMGKLKNRWQLVEFTWDREARTGTLYLNGEKVAEQTDTANATADVQDNYHETWDVGLKRDQCDGMVFHGWMARVVVSEGVQRMEIFDNNPSKSINLALGRPAYQIDSYSSYEASGPQKAVDGNHANKWRAKSCAGTRYSEMDAQRNQPVKQTNWLAVELDRAYPITLVRLQNRGDCCGERLADFDIVVTNVLPTSGQDFKKGSDYNNGQICYHKTGQVSQGAREEFVCTTVLTGKYVVVVKARETQLTLCEVEVYQGVDVTSGIGSCYSPHNGECRLSWRENIVSLSGKTVEQCKAECTHTYLECKSFNVRPGSCDLKRATCPTGTLFRVTDTSRLYYSKNSCTDIGTGATTAVKPPVNSNGNLALGKTAWQLGTTSGGVASRAVDGNTNGVFNRGTCTHTSSDMRAKNQGTKNWWAVDLEKETKVKRVILYNRADCCGDRLADFDVVVTNAKPSEGKKLEYNAATDICSHQSGKIGASKSFTCSDGGLTGRYVAVVISRKQILTLCEAEVFDN